MATIPAKLQHDCSPAAQIHLIGHRVQTGGPYNWRLLKSHREAQDIDVIYCPWCGAELNEWAKLQLAQRSKPRLVQP